MSGTHKRIVTVAGSSRQPGGSTAAWIRKRMRNKNPNCNHNNNFVFYQPTYCSVKYTKGKA